MMYAAFSARSRRSGRKGQGVPDEVTFDPAERGGTESPSNVDLLAAVADRHHRALDRLWRGRRGGGTAAFVFAASAGAGRVTAGLRRRAAGFSGGA